jgi:hypothetical protein
MDINNPSFMHICQNVVKKFYLGEKLEYQQENEEIVDGKIKFWFSLQVTGIDSLGIGGKFS